MPGNLNSGRRPQSDDRTPKAYGTPSRPEFACEAAGEFWGAYVDELVEMGVVGAVDAPQLSHLCEAWGLLRAAYEAAVADPIDKDTRIAYVSYSTEFSRLAAAFGLDPKSRSRLKRTGADAAPAILPRFRE